MANSSLMAKMLKSAGKTASVLSSSDFAEKQVLCTTTVPMVNVMLSGALDGGLKPGLTQVVGDSRTFKSNFCLLLVKAYLDKYPDAICIFLDNEFGAAQYFKPMGIDPNRVIHIPVTDIEDLKQRTVAMLEDVAAGEKVIFFLDSLSQIASLKETNDAIEGKVVADMTRAKMINSYMRIITPRITMKNLPFLFINNYYDDTTNQYAEPILKGGKQAFLSSDTIYFVTRSQVKDADKVLKGWSFNYNVMKSRTVKEKSKFSIEVLYSGGINEDSGLFDAAMEFGFVAAPKQGWYQINLDGLRKETLVRRKEIEENPAFFKALIANADFKKAVHDKYALEAGEMFESKLEIIDDETGEVVVISATDTE